MGTAGGFRETRSGAAPPASPFPFVASGQWPLLAVCCAAPLAVDRNAEIGWLWRVAVVDPRTAAAGGPDGGGVPCGGSGP